VSSPFSWWRWALNILLLGEAERSKAKECPAVGRLSTNTYNRLTGKKWFHCTTYLEYFLHFILRSERTVRYGSEAVINALFKVTSLLWQKLFYSCLDRLVCLCYSVTLVNPNLLNTKDTQMLHFSNLDFKRPQDVMNSSSALLLFARQLLPHAHLCPWSTLHTLILYVKFQIKSTFTFTFYCCKENKLYSNIFSFIVYFLNPLFVYISQEYRLLDLGWWSCSSASPMDHSLPRTLLWSSGTHASTTA